ncbi:uncharacterized protein I303_106492 [Kwoniella dejecticola CBS 10117]|uniref:Uncharacterized protein n=1 Tax=Kwoniella dejecticola CBS 10117 TaxID=1296121 RepID=A0A1A5ZUJ4_9TREE|nr:uncharacterized protein I303_08250 [Kwoniella dejecticola CBS 10117]OBR81480.1 hypothetical protein I303_08250 [Kwoniella dejecticola CBS 10117]
MSKLPSGANGPTIIPPQHLESKRDRKRRETVNKIEMLHDESWRNRDEKFSALYKEYHIENRAVNSQPPTSAKYLLRVYPMAIERDALLEAAEIEYQYKAGQAKRMYESERESIEAQYWDARDQVRQRLLASIEERRRKLREEKEGGDVVTDTLLEAQIRPRPTRKLPIRNRSTSSALHSRGDTPSILNGNGNNPSTSVNLNNANSTSRTSEKDGGDGMIKSSDILLHSLISPQLAIISTDDIISSSSSSLVVHPPPNGQSYIAHQPGKRGPRGKGATAAGAGGSASAAGAGAGAGAGGGAGGVGVGGINGGIGLDGDLLPTKDSLNVPGTATALGIASGQVNGSGSTANGGPRSRGVGGTRDQALTLGRSLADLSKMTSASQLECSSDWARMQGSGGRNRRTRGD